MLLVFYEKAVFPDLEVVSWTKKEYGSIVHFLQIFIKSIKSISDEWLG